MNLSFLFIISRIRSDHLKNIWSTCDPTSSYYYFFINSTVNCNIKTFSFNKHWILKKKIYIYMKVLKLPIILCTISWSGLFSVLYFSNFATQIFVCENSVWPRLSNGKLCYGFVGGKETPLTKGLKLESVWITAVMIDSWRYLFVVSFFFPELIRKNHFCIIFIVVIHVYIITHFVQLNDGGVSAWHGIWHLWLVI